MPSGVNSVPASNYVALHPLTTPSIKMGLPIALHGTTPQGFSYGEPNVTQQIQQGVASLDPSAGTAGCKSQILALTLYQQSKVTEILMQSPQL